MKHRKPLSRTFPKYHPKSGEPTGFVQLVWNSINAEALNFNRPDELSVEWEEYLEFNLGFKHTTVRGGNRVKVGDLLQFYVWEGKPYRSKQINVTPYFEVKKVWDFHISSVSGDYLLNDKKIPIEVLKTIALNDGFTNLDDFELWFKLKSGEGFSGQIICWNETVNY